MNLPNKITLFRVLLIPAFVLFLLAPLNFGKIEIHDIYQLKVTTFIAILIFSFAAITDWVDGHLARKHNLITNFGKFMDPLADKLLMAAAFIALIEMQLAPSWMVILVISREIAVTGLRLIASGDGTVIAAGQSGKIKTTVQITTVIVVLFNFHWILNDILLWATTIITLYSGIEYFMQNRKLISYK